MTDDTDTKTTIYIMNERSYYLGSYTILQGYVKNIVYDCESENNIFLSDEGENVPVRASHESYYITNGGETRKFEWILGITASNTSENKLGFYNPLISTCSYFNTSGSVSL